MVCLELLNVFSDLYIMWHDTMWLVTQLLYVACGNVSNKIWLFLIEILQQTTDQHVGQH